ncbi:hypothetical protein [Streptomyces sp. NBC_00343]|uniref:hypothetical protein n=1 Tax=Streptomyces sp. NBC_00343 TaxID=2975719 RepID=UPI002E297CF5|nr:hypothetical protein [Streptomyces sp. NBC_00343]
MQMSNDQLVAEFYETVMELHLARRQIQSLSAQNDALQSRVSESEPEGPCCSEPPAAEPAGS